MDRLHVRRAPNQLAGMAPRVLQEHREGRTYAPGIERCLAPADGLQHALQPVVLHRVGELVQGGSGRAGPGAVLEGIGLGERDLLKERERSLELLLAFPREPHDRVGGERDVGTGGPNARDEGKVVAARVPAVHRRQDAVGASLKRQVQVRHELGLVAVRRDQVVAHVARMARGVAQALDAADADEVRDQVRERAHAAVGPQSVIGVDVLPEKGELAHALACQGARLRLHVGDGARIFGAPGVGDHAEGAELVAALLHRQEGRRCAGAGANRQRGELVPVGKCGLHYRGAIAPGALQQGAELVVALRPHDHIDAGLAPHDLGALGLGDAAGHGDDGVPARPAPALLDLADAAEVGVDLLGGLLADVAGVENDYVGVLDGGGLGEAQGGQQLHDALAVVDVHLTAERLDVDLARAGVRPCGSDPRAPFLETHGSTPEEARSILAAAGLPVRRQHVKLRQWGQPRPSPGRRGLTPLPALTLGGHAVELELVADQLEAQVLRHALLQALDLLVAELDDAPGLDVYEVVVMAARGGLVAPAAGSEIVPLQDALGLEQPQRAVDGGERDASIDGVRAPVHLLNVGVVLGGGEHAGNHAPLARHAQALVGAELLDATCRLR